MFMVGPTITATKSHAGGPFHLGNTITYTVNISDTIANATGVEFTDTPDANTTFVAGSVMASPVAVDDSYPCTGNLSISIPAASGVLANDYLGLNPTATITTSDTTSANGGTVAVAADGSFTYEPAAGFAGTDTFTYTLSNTVGTSVETVTITVSHRIWFINNAAGACSSGTCNGRLSHPFTSLSAFITAAVDAANDVIFIYQGSSAYSGNLTLKTNERLIGQGDPLTSNLGFTPAANGPALPGATAKPTLSGTLTLANGVTVLALDLSTGVLNGMTGTSGGGITVGDAAPTATNGLTITTTTGTPLTLSSLGGAFTFRSITCGAATHGISLTSTTGSLTVTGDGSTANSGGSITGTTSAGIQIAGAQSVSLSFMSITNSGTSGISASGVNGFTLDSTTMSDTAGAVTDNGVQLDNVSGTATISNCTISGSPLNGVQVHNIDTNLAAFNLTNTTIQNEPNNGTTTFGADGLLFIAEGTTTVTAATITGCTFHNVFSDGIQVQAKHGTNGEGTISSFTVTGNTFTNNNIGAEFDISQGAHLTFTMGTIASGNVFNTQHNLNIVCGASSSNSGATMTGKIQNNTIGTQGTKDSGSAIGGGIRALLVGPIAGTLRVDSNTIHEVPNGRGIDLEQDHDTNGSGGAKFEVTNNTIVKPTGTNQSVCGAGQPCPSASIWISADNFVSTGSGSVCSVVTGNTAYDPTTFAGFGGEAAYYLQANQFTGPSTHTLEGNTSLTPHANIAANNTVTNSASAPIIIDPNDLGGPNAVTVVTAGTCGVFPASAPLTTKEAGAVPAGPAPRSTSTLRASGFGVGRKDLPVLTQDELTPIVSAAIYRWSQLGLSPEQMAELQSLRFVIRKLPLPVLAAGAPHHLLLSENGSGYGWYVDPTPYEDSEFDEYVADREFKVGAANPESPAYTRMDLLTVVMREMGYAIGLDEVY
ncbi:MAG TPA: Ig-like domain-containing protein, partial [Blastocatellia bacterium]|nr:Ig-like domain-containing protein [Blastocatellia bacterium]